MWHSRLFAVLRKRLSALLQRKAVSAHVLGILRHEQLSLPFLGHCLSTNRSVRLFDRASNASAFATKERLDGADITWHLRGVQRNDG